MVSVISKKNNKLVIEHYKNGKREGNYKKYINNVLIIDRNYSNHTLHGDYFAYYQNGKLLMHAIYNNGVLVERKMYHKSGEPFKN